VRTYPFSVEILLDPGGVRSVRVLGKDWTHSAEAHSLLQRLSPLIQKLDESAKSGAGTNRPPEVKSIQ
jgi:hypothetical protein